MKTVVIRGPVFSKSGYGEHARLVYRSIKSAIDKEGKPAYDIYIQPTVWGNTSWTLKDTKETQEMKECVRKTLTFKGTYDVSFQIQLPNEWQKVASYNIGVTAAIETDRAHPGWIHNSNEVIDEIITISKHSARSMTFPTFNAVNKETSRVTQFKLEKEVSIIPFPVKNFKIKKKHNALLKKVSTPFNFLSVLQASPRKNMGSLLRWFVEEFKNDEEVGLIIKGSKVCNSKIDRRMILAEMKIILRDFPNRKCKVYLAHGHLEEDELHSLYENEKVRCYVTTTHGEGFGLPIFEAAYSGVPVVAPAWSGHVDYLYMPVENEVSKKITRTPMFTKVKFKVEQVQQEAVAENIITPESRWCFSDEKSFKKAVRSVYDKISIKESEALKLKDYLVKEYSSEKIMKQYVDILDKHLKEQEEQIEDWFTEIETDIEIYD